MEEIRGSISGIGSEAIFYYIIAGMMMLYIWLKFPKTLPYTLLIFFFSSGIVTYTGFEAARKIVVLFGSLLLVLGNYKRSNKKSVGFINFMFFLLSVSFGYSVFVNLSSGNNPFLQIFSQYSKYLSVFFMFHFFRSNPSFVTSRTTQLFFIHIIIVQVILAFFKLFIIGYVEAVVGSMSFYGGSLATIFPCLAFIFYWYYKAGEFKKKDWAFIVLLLIIGIASNKRAIWFIYPSIVIGISYFVFKKEGRRRMRINPIILLFFGLMVFYLGVKLNPSLNPERSRWGTFDLTYVFDYSLNYTFGGEREGSGRGGGNAALLNKEIDKNLLFGYGVSSIISKNYNTFNASKFGVDGKASISSFGKKIISFGIVFSIVILIYMISFSFIIPNIKIRILLIAFMTWEYILYLGVLFDYTTIAIFFMYIINYITFYYERREKKNTLHP